MQPPNISPIFTDQRYETWNRIILSLKTFFKEVQDLLQNLLKFVRKDNLALDMDQKVQINDIYHKQYTIQDCCNEIVKSNDVLKEHLSENDKKIIDQLNILLHSTSHTINELDHHILSYY